MMHVQKEKDKMQLEIQELTPDSFAPFGQVITQQARTHDASGTGWQWWGDLALLPSDGRPYSVGYLDLQPTARRFDWAERHMRSAEMIIPAGGECLIYVAPPDYPDEPDRLAALDRFQVFRVRRGQAVILRPGVWHGAPLAFDRPLNAVVLLLEGTGATDLKLVRFTETPVEIK